MENYIKIGNKEIEISKETANNLKSQFSDKIKIEDDFYWYKKENENIDTAKIESIRGSADLQGCSSDLSSLESIGGYAYLQGCSKELKKSLVKTLKKSGNIYVEFIDEPMTLEEFKEYAEKL